jgi:hypothetical protein
MPNKNEEQIFAQDLENPIDLTTKITTKIWSWVKKPSLSSALLALQSTITFVQSGKENLEGKIDGVAVEKDTENEKEKSFEENDNRESNSNHSKENPTQDKNDKLGTRIKKLFGLSSPSVLKKNFSTQSNDYTQNSNSQNDTLNKPVKGTHTANLINSLKNNRK